MSVPVWLARRAKVAALVAAQRRRIAELEAQMRGLAGAHDQELRAVRAALRERLDAAQDQVDAANEQASRWCLEAESRRTEQVRQAKQLAALQQEHQALIKQLGVAVRQRDELRRNRDGG